MAILLSREEIEEEDEWIRSLGLTPPSGHLLTARPFTEPLGRRSFLVPARWHWAAAPATLNPHDLIRDLDILRTAMRNAYAGWESAEQRGWTWDAFFQSWRRDLESAQGNSLPVLEAFGPWKKLLDFQLDNHSGPVIPDGFQRLSTTLLLSEPPHGPIVEPAGGRARRAWVAGADGLRECWAVTGPFRGKASTEVRDSAGRRLAAEPGTSSPELYQRSLRALSGRDDDSLSCRRLADDIVYIRLPALSWNISADAGGDLPAAHQGTLVVDLRGNQGGAAKIVLPVLERLVGSLNAVFAVRTRESRLASALAWGHAQSQLKGMCGPLTGPALEMASQTLRRVTATDDHGGGSAWHERPPGWSYRQHRFPCAAGRRVIVLVDQNCGSDGELLVFLLASLPGSVIAGPNTAGVAGYFVLPHTRVRFRLAMAITDLYGDGRPVDGYGLDSDVLLPADELLDESGLISLVRHLEACYTA
jgi:Peptidase family S41